MLYNAGNDNLYSYRYDWDDHRKYFIADFKKLIGLLMQLKFHC